MQGDSASLLTDPAKQTLHLNEDTLWSGLPVDRNNLDAPRWLAPIRKTALEQMDYEPADRLCQEMQGLFAEAYQPLGNLHVDCEHCGEVINYRRELSLRNAAVKIRYTAGGVDFDPRFAIKQPIKQSMSAGQPSCTMSSKQPKQWSLQISAVHIGRVRRAGAGAGFAVCDSLRIRGILRCGLTLDLRLSATHPGGLRHGKRGQLCIGGTESRVAEPFRTIQRRSKQEKIPPTDLQAKQRRQVREQSRQPPLQTASRPAARTTQGPAYPR